MIVLLILGIHLFWGGNEYNNYANKLYSEGKYEEALRYYKEVTPPCCETYYNMGNALTALGKVGEALTCYAKAGEMAGDSALLSSVEYNRGVALFKMGDLQSALEAFKNCVRWDPDAMDARHNIEYILSLLQQQDQNQGKENQQEGKDKEKEQNEGDQQTPGQENVQHPSSSNVSSNQDTLSLKALLDALTEEQEELLKKRRIEVHSPRNVKDW